MQVLCCNGNNVLMLLFKLFFKGPVSTKSIVLGSGMGSKNVEWYQPKVSVVDLRNRTAIFLKCVIGQTGKSWTFLTFEFAYRTEMHIIVG